MTLRLTLKSLSVAFLIAVSGCSSTAKRTPAEVGPGSPRHEPPRVYIPSDLYEGSVEFLAFVSSDRFYKEDCSAFLRQVYDGLFSTEVRVYDQSILATKWTEVIENFFKARVALRKKLGQWTASGPVEPACVLAIRDVFRAGRYLEDFIGEWKLRPRANPDPTPAFTGNSPHVLKVDSASGFAFPASLRSGDVLLSRGDAFTSAAIARLADGDSQFSHMALVYIDPRDTTKVYAVESHIERGTVITPISEYATDGKVRAVVFRHPDADLAARAAENMYLKAKAGVDRGDPIHYDFTMNMTDHSALFCSEVVKQGFEEASNGVLRVPMFTSRFQQMSPDFLSRLGVTATESFMPGDIEVDPRFDLLVEWRDYSKIRQTHLRDAILWSMFAWMKEKNYIFHGDVSSRFAEGVVWHARTWPVFGRMLKNRFPPYMPQRTLGTFVLFNQVASRIYDEIDRKDQAYQRENRLRMAPRDLDEALERIRALDAQRYRWHKAWMRGHLGVEPDPALFHEEFRP